MAAFFPVKAWFTYWLNAVEEHSLHSPFLFDLYRTILKGTTNPETFSDAERLRKKLLQDQRILNGPDIGSSSSLNGKQKTVANTARYGISSQKFSELYYRLGTHFKAKMIVELGTSFGINTLYLARIDNAEVHTFEGVPEIQEIASLTFEFADVKNVTLHPGYIDKTLPGFLQQSPRIDMVFMDANHRYEPTVHYFRLLVPRLGQKSIVIIDDIHRSREMERAWNKVRSNELVSVSIDLYQCGILFFDPSLSKQHVVMQF